MPADKKDGKILVVEDDTSIAEGIRDNLELEGYEVRWAADGAAGLKEALGWQPDVILLDVMMPKMNGFEVLRDLRKRGVNAPVILVTARAEEFDRCLGLDLGADDYVVKPFSLKELLSRVAAQLRRFKQFQGAAGLLAFGEVEVDFASFKLKVGGKQVHVTSTELSVLKFLAERDGRVLSREQILDGVWGHGYFGGARTVDNFIHALRKKIEPDPEHPRHLCTVRGAGYCFTRRAGGDPS